MLKDGVVLLIVVVLALGAILVWWTQVPTRSLSATDSSSTWGGQTAGPRDRASEATPKAGPKVVKPAGIPKPTATPVVEQPSVVEATASPEEAAVGTRVVEPDPPPFPAVEQVASGVRKDSITGKYGDPALAAVTLNDGHLVETLIYARKRSRSATIIRLEDGKVSEAYSRSEPVLPSGLSVPLHGPNKYSVRTTSPGGYRRRPIPGFHDQVKHAGR